MRKLPLTTIAELAGAKLLMPPGPDNGADGIVIDAVSTDTRTIAPGSLFVPLVGERFDGHEFAPDAAAKGASAALWLESREEGRPEGLPLLLVDDTLTALQKLAHAYRKSLNVKVVGITGSNGKRPRRI